jgi:ABC-type sugar transport system ATPase subunit
MSFLTEDRKHYGILPKMAVWENILITVINLRLGELATKLRRIGGLLRVSSAKSHAAALVREMRIRSTSVDLPIAELSGGNQQKALFARALSAGSQIIILDEPTKGVDAGAKVEIYRVLQSLVDRGIGIIVVSSELPEILAVSNRIVVLKSGLMTATLDRDSTNDEQLMHFATA